MFRKTQCSSNKCYWNSPKESKASFSKVCDLFSWTDLKKGSFWQGYFICQLSSHTHIRLCNIYCCKQ